MKFDDYKINTTLKKNLETIGYKRPTDIQFKSIPSILNGEDVLAIAQTGTGKTAAFAIPVIHKIHQKKFKSRRKDGILCLIMAPTHELAIQIHEVFELLSRGTLAKTVCIFGGVDQAPQIKALESGADILIATPGRMFDLRSQGYLNLTRVDTLILDEADHMLDLGFIKDIEDIIGHLPKRRQTLFFSATINKKIKKLAYSLIKSNAIRIQISPKNPVAKNVYHSVMFIEMDDKRYFLERLIRTNETAKILVFVRTKVRAERVCKAMERVGISSGTMHGDKSHNNRINILDSFKSGATRVLIATDVSARGIHIPEVNYVVNYDLPDKDENYVHRVGRTGRADQRGNAVSFVSEGELEMLGQIEEFVGGKIPVIEVDKQDYNATINFSSDTRGMDWKTLIKKELEKAEEDAKLYKKKNKKRKR
jgi:ATP-dependent RNA helicase RhlE